MSYFGDIRLGETHNFKFTTRQISGAPFTLAGSPVISAYPSSSTTQLTAGITLSVDFDSVTGLNNIAVIASGGNGYVTATDYALVITTGTVNSVSVVGEVVGSFSIENRSALMPTTAALTLDVSATGEAGVDWANVGGKTTSNALTGTTIAVTQKVDVDTIKTNPVVNAGTITFPTTATLASTTNITAGTVTTATNVTTVNGLAANVITSTACNNDFLTAAKIANGAIDLATFASDVGNLSTRSGTAQAGGASTITLDSGASAVDGFYDNQIVQLTGGTGAGQTAIANSGGYVGSTKVLTVNRTWATNPDNTTTFTLLPFGAVPGATAPTAAQVATAVWQDTTSGDFTVASSIGKSLFTSGAVPGAAGGLFIAGTNAATTITTSLTTTFTGNLTGSVGSVTGAVGSVTGAVGSVTGNIGGDLQGTLTVTERNAIATATLARSLAAESYAADGAVPTLSQVLYLIQQTIGDFAISGTTISVKKLDGSTEAATYTLDSAVLPTSRTRAT